MAKSNLVPIKQVANFSHAQTNATASCSVCICVQLPLPIYLLRPLNDLRCRLRCWHEDRLATHTSSPSFSNSRPVAAELEASPSGSWVLEMRIFFILPEKTAGHFLNCHASRKRTAGGITDRGGIRRRNLLIAETCDCLHILWNLIIELSASLPASRPRSVTLWSTNASSLAKLFSLSVHPFP
jgi:hypothetical protein